jgi:glutamate formiminotransferase
MPDFGPRGLHRTAGAVLVSARPPLIAFNVELAPPATMDDARAIAARIREGGAEGLASVRAIGLWLAQRDVAQVSMNIEDDRSVRLADVIAAIESHATVAEAELVGLAPAHAFDGFPEDIPVRNKRLIEDALGA